MNAAWAIGVLCAWLVVGCGGPHAGSGNAPAPVTGAVTPTAGVLNLYIWANYLAPETLSSFETRTGIKVRVSYFESNEMLDARMLAGHSGFDVVVPTGALFEHQIRSGAYAALDKDRLPNAANLDKEIMSRVAVSDPGNAHGVVYLWGTFGLGYNTRMLADRLPGVRLDSWRLLFDPDLAGRLASCGINVVDDPVGVTKLVLQYLGRDPNSQDASDLAAVEAVLMRMRPFVRTIDTAGAIDALANGAICIGLGYSGDVVQARRRAAEARNGVSLGYFIPREGSLLWFDLLAIPADAPNSANAHVFIDYLMEPRVIADVSNAIGFANANRAAVPLLAAWLTSDTAVYPTPAERQRLAVQTEDTTEHARAVTRLWQRFKTAH